MECAFQGVIIKPGQKVTVTAQWDEDVYETMHFTQAALGEKPKAGPHVVYVEKDGQRYAIGTLDAARCPQFSCDLTFAMDQVTLSHSGTGDVHLTGYRVEQMVAGGSSDEEGRYGFSDDEGSEEEVSSDDEESDDEEAPDAVPLKGTAKRAVKPRARVIDDEAEEASSEEEEEEGSESEEELQKAPRRVVVHGGYEDSSEEELSSGSEDEESEEEGEEERPAAQPAAGAKRPATQQPPSKTPQPAKKARPDGEQQQKAPATAPAKLARIADLEKRMAEQKAAAEAAAAGGKTPKKAPEIAKPANEAEYLEALKQALQAAGGPLKLAQLGTKVQRPKSAPKQKHLIDRHPQVFKYDKAKDEVSLAKKK